MFEKILLNMIESEEIPEFECYKIPLSLRDIPKEDHRKSMKKIHRFSRSKFPCSLFGDHIYLAGDSHFVENFIPAFERDLRISLDWNSLYESPLKLSNPYDQGIIIRLLYRHFENLLMLRGFIRPRRGNVAMPRHSLQDNVDFPLIHKGKFYESFYYKFEIINNRVYLIIEPKITTMIPYNNYEEGDWVVPHCLSDDCELYQQCDIIPANSVKFKEMRDFSDETCRLRTSGGALVYDPKKDQEIVIPKKILFQEPNFSEIPFREIRNLAVKPPDNRITYTRRFFKLIFEQSNFNFRVGKNNIHFSDGPFSFDYNPERICQPLCDGYSYVYDIPNIFGEGLQNTSAFQGLRDYGAYSSNRRNEPRYGHPEIIRIFTLYPPNVEGLLNSFLDRLKIGVKYYAGFSKTSTPFRCDLQIEKYPLDARDELSFISKAEACIKNIVEEYPRRSGDIFLFAIPDYYESFYDQIKDFCFSRSIRSQVIRKRNLIMNPYLLFNFSLSIYSKAGGTPWNLESSNFNIAACFIGMKFARRTEGRFGSGEFFMGAADVFNAYGEHISFALHQNIVTEPTRGLHVDKAFMKELILKAVERYKDKMNLIPDKLLIYRPESFHPQEVDAVREILSEMDTRICYLVWVQHNTRLRAYDPAISLQVRRGTYFLLKRNEIVLFPTGYLESEKKAQKLGTPKAVQLNVRKMESNSENVDLNCEEIYEICRNYLAFTRLRWNSLGSRIRETLPVFASGKVADWLKKGYRGLEGIDIRDIL